jgi:hypothetical protein
MRTHPTPKQPGGQPTKFRPDLCERVVELMAEGRSLDGCAALLGVHPDSLSAPTYWEGRLLDIAKGGSGNAQAIQWALRNRSRASAGWDHAHSKVEVSGPDGGPVQQQVTRTLNASTLNEEQLEVLEIPQLVPPSTP